MSIRQLEGCKWDPKLEAYVRPGYVPRDKSELADELLGKARGPAPFSKASAAPPHTWARLGDVVKFIIVGEPASKSNRRRLVTRTDPETKKERPAFIKSKKALAYEHNAALQIPHDCRLRLEGPVAVTLRIWYATERPDLDESVILDVLQDHFAGPKGNKRLAQAGVYRNDRQVREKHVFHGIDRIHPRAEIEVQPLAAQQVSLL